MLTWNVDQWPKGAKLVVGVLMALGATIYGSTEFVSWAQGVATETEERAVDRADRRAGQRLKAVEVELAALRDEVRAVDARLKEEFGYLRTRIDAGAGSGGNPDAGRAGAIREKEQ